MYKGTCLRPVAVPRNGRSIFEEPGEAAAARIQEFSVARTIPSERAPRFIVRAVDSLRIRDLIFGCYESTYVISEIRSRWCSGFGLPARHR